MVGSPQAHDWVTTQLEPLFSSLGSRLDADGSYGEPRTDAGRRPGEGISSPQVRGQGSHLRPRSDADQTHELGGVGRGFWMIVAPGHSFTGYAARLFTGCARHATGASTCIRSAQGGGGPAGESRRGRPSCGNCCICTLAGGGRDGGTRSWAVTRAPADSIGVRVQHQSALTTCFSALRPVIDPIFLGTDVLAFVKARTIVPCFVISATVRRSRGRHADRESVG